MANNEESRPVITLTRRPDFVPSSARRQTRTVRLTFHARTHHTRVLSQRGQGAIELNIPVSCPMCKSGSEYISEIEKENQWWWSCAACSYDWAPVPKR